MNTSTEKVFSVLAVDDEPDILEVVRYNLAQEGLLVRTAASGQEALQVARTFLPDVIVLDLLLPGIDGYDVCRLLKLEQATQHIQVLVLSALGEDVHIIKGLEIGADDYLSKPFSPKVLIARVKNLLRRIDPSASSSTDSSIVNFGPFKIDQKRFEVFLDNEPLVLTSTEFRLLSLLISEPGRVFARHEILKRVQGHDYPATDRSVDVQVLGLRRKLGKHGALIETVRGFGYRIKSAE